MIRQPATLSPTFIWPRSPRPVEHETLASYTMRLGILYGIEMQAVFELLNLPRTFDAQPLERHLDQQWVNRLAATTHRPIQRFESMRFLPHERFLPSLERTGFCPHCWIHRRHQDGAYLARSWALPHVLWCEVHQCWLDAWARSDDWSGLFNCRNEWVKRIRRAIPSSWVEACDRLGVEPSTAMKRVGPALVVYQQNVGQVMSGISASDKHQLVSDLACFLQVQWDPEKPARKGTAFFTIQDDELCFEQSLCGPLTARLGNLIAAEHLGRMLLTGAVSKLAGALTDEMKGRRRTHVEEWWLKKRSLHWPQKARVRLFKLLNIKHHTPCIPPFHRCRDCVRHSLNVERLSLHVTVDNSLRCRWSIDERSVKEQASPVRNAAGYSEDRKRHRAPS